MLLPVAKQTSSRAVLNLSFMNQLDSFFPFDPYLLRRQVLSINETSHVPYKPCLISASHDTYSSALFWPIYVELAEEFLFLNSFIWHIKSSVMRTRHFAMIRNTSSCYSITSWRQFYLTLSWKAQYQETKIKEKRKQEATDKYTFVRSSHPMFKLFYHIYFFSDHRSAKFIKPIYQEWEGLEHDEEDDDDEKKHPEAEVTYVWFNFGFVKC